MNETHRAVAPVHGVRVYCTGCGAVRESSHTLLCPLVCAFVAGALRRIHAEALLPPDPKGWISSVATPATWTDLLGARAERVPELFVLSLSHSWECNRQWVVNPPARLPWISRRCRESLGPSDARLHALLNASAGSLKAASSNASAASESTTAGGLEASSQGTAGAERFENASSKFRWNLSPLLPLFVGWKITHETDTQWGHPK